ncbi:MAG: hypothetical protein ACE361_06045 [Aureliella sp.]
MLSLFAVSILGILLGTMSGFPHVFPQTGEAPDKSDCSATDSKSSGGDSHAKAEVLPSLLAAHDLLPLKHLVYIGGQPSGEAAFRELRKLGVQTVVSVDGARPDIGLAKRFGIRYVHLPLRYSGVESAQYLELAATLRLYKGPFYFHCHHGRHRAPAAAACALVGAGVVSSADAIQLLEVAGTGKEYAGLWASVRDQNAISDLDDRLPRELPSVAETTPFADSMSQLSRLVDRWQATESKVTGEVVGQKKDELALLIRECFEEASRPSILPKKFQTEKFRQRMFDSKRLAKQLESAQQGADQASLFKRLRSECKSCHEQYRN